MADACRTQHAETAPACTDCPRGWYTESTSLDWDEDCDRCQECGAGQERVGCGLGSQGSCAPWTTPEVTDVSGAGTLGGITNGGEQLRITGLNFAGFRGGEVWNGRTTRIPGPEDIAVRYRLPDNPYPYDANQYGTGWYYAQGCAVVAPCSGESSCEMTCLTAEGVGTGLVVQVIIFEGAAATMAADPQSASPCDNAGAHPCRSAIFPADVLTAEYADFIHYAAPLISEYEGTGANKEAATTGGEILTIKGANFGPPCAAPCPWIDKAVLVELEPDKNEGGGGGGSSSSGGGSRRRRRLADSTDGTSAKQYVMDHTACFVISHSMMKCIMPRGAGPSFKVIITIAAQTSVETSMSYAPPTLSKLTLSGETAELTSIAARGNQLVTLHGENLANDHTELDSVTLGSASLGQVVFTIPTPPLPPTGLAPGQCRVKTAAEQIECRTVPGALRGHMWTVTVGGQTSEPSNPTHYNAPEILSCLVNTLSERQAGQPSLFRTPGGDAVISGTDLGTTADGSYIPGVVTEVILYDPNAAPDAAPMVKSAEPQPPSLSQAELDVLKFRMPVAFGLGWQVAIRISKTSSTSSGNASTATYAPWPSTDPASASFNYAFGYQGPSILQTKTTFAGSQIQIDIKGDNFCASNSGETAPLNDCGVVYACNSGPLNESMTLCFAGGDPASGPAAGAVALSTANGATYTDWKDHNQIRVRPQGNNATFDNRFIFVQVGAADASGARSLPAYQSSTNPKIHDICYLGAGSDYVNADFSNCGFGADNLKVPQTFPTSGKDPAVSTARARIVLLCSDTAVTGGIVENSLKVSVGATTLPPAEQLIVSAVETGGRNDGKYDCHNEDSTVSEGKCVKIVMELPANGWTGKNQDVTVWVATIKSNSGTVDFDPPEMQHLYKHGTTEDMGGVPTGGASAGSNGELRKFDLVGKNFGSSQIRDNQFQLTFVPSSAGGSPTPLYIQPEDPSAPVAECDEYSHEKLTGCKFPEGQGRDYRLAMTVFGHPIEYFPDNLVDLINYAPATLEAATVPPRGSTRGGYTVEVRGTNMGLEKPIVEFGGAPESFFPAAVPLDVVTQDGGYHDSFVVVIPEGAGTKIPLVVKAGTQLSTTSMLFSYEVPTTASITPQVADTSGRDPSTGNRTIAVLTGTGFGRDSDANSTEADLPKIEFVPLNDPSRDSALPFVVPWQDIISVRNHTTIRFYVPPGFGSEINVVVSIRGQKSPGVLSFQYRSPAVSLISMSCAGYDTLRDDFVPDDKGEIGGKGQTIPRIARDSAHYRTGIQYHLRLHLTSTTDS